jgi:hypothetical protein
MENILLKDVQTSTDGQTGKTKPTQHPKFWTFQDNTLEVSRNLCGQAISNFAP